MNRYIPNSSKLSTRYDGKRVMLTTRYPRIPVGANDIYIFANEADYLDSLANKFYRDPSLWWVIAQANNIKLGMKVPAGMQIRIPQNIDAIIARFSNENSK